MKPKESKPLTIGGMGRQIARGVRELGQSCCDRHMLEILKGTRYPSRVMAPFLEQATGIERRCWLWPDEFTNPIIEKYK